MCTHDASLARPPADVDAEPSRPFSDLFFYSAGKSVRGWQQRDPERVDNGEGKHRRTEEPPGTPLDTLPLQLASKKLQIVWRRRGASEEDVGAGCAIQPKVVPNGTQKRKEHDS